MAEQLNEYRKRFQQILEYVDVSSLLNEAEPEDDMNAEPDPMAGGEPVPMDNQMPAGDPMAGAPDAGMGNAPNDISADTQDGQGVEGLNPQGGEEEMPTPESDMEEGDDVLEDDIDTMEEGDEVIDVDDLTGYQRKTAKGVGKISDELKDLKRLISSFEDKVNANNQGIEDLKKELAKRAPNAEERITMRQTKSGPFTQTVEDYWENNAPDNYKVTSRDEIDNPKYVITKSDIDGITDWNSISKSFDEMAEFNDLRNIFDL